nr:unnamed protein product [Digitaria exilis]
MAAEELDDADLAELAPQGAVAREDETHGAGGHDAPHAWDPWPRRECGVVRLHDLHGGVGGRGDDDADLAELQVHERRVVPARELGHGAVRERAAEEQVVEVADER